MRTRNELGSWAMIGVVVVCVASLVAACADDEAPVDTDPTLVTLSAGQVQGDDMGGAIRFLAIPFAAPPVGELRWKAPVEPESWSGIRHETDFASACPQAESRQQPESQQEDCLYLNVWRPATATRNAPVMVWFHGGGNTTGSASDLLPNTTEEPLWYDGRVFAERHGIVVVTTNYRLGGFGFFSHPALEAEGSPVANQGLLDQVFVLQWVRDEIAGFGGDPNNVTIFGQSAGAGDVCLHMASPLSRGLFHRAISQSGSCTRRPYRSSEDLATEMQAYAQERGCTGDLTAVLACLRQQPVDVLIDLAPTDRLEGMTSATDLFRPVIDGYFLERAPIEAFEAGDIAQVPYILGTNDDERMLYWVARTGPADEDAYQQELVDRYGPQWGPRAAALYPVSDYDDDYRMALVKLESDVGAICSARHTARVAAAAGLDAYLYTFDIDWSIAAPILLAAHSAEISHVFGVPYNESPENQAVAVEMNAYWARFAATGDPNGPDAPAQWPSLSAESDTRLEFVPDITTVEGYRAAHCDFWDEYAAAE